MSTNTLKPWVIKKSKIIHKTRWIEVIEDTCLADTTELIYTYTKRVDEGPIIIAEESDGAIWLVQQYRHPVKKILWQLPAEGKLPSEPWIDAAKRGLQEELQLTAEKWENLGEYFPDPGGLEQKYQLFVARELEWSKNTQKHTEDGEVEDLRIQKFSRKAIDTMILNGELCDNWTLAALYVFDRYKEKLFTDNKP